MEYDVMKLRDILFCIGSTIVVAGIQCIGIGVMATNGAQLWELIVAAIIMFGVDLMLAAFLLLED